MLDPIRPESESGDALLEEDRRSWPLELRFGTDDELEKGSLDLWPPGVESLERALRRRNLDERPLVFVLLLALLRSLSRPLRTVLPLRPLQRCVLEG